MERLQCQQLKISSDQHDNPCDFGPSFGIGVTNFSAFTAYFQLLTYWSRLIDFMLGSVKYYQGDFGSILWVLLASSEEQPQSCQSVRGNLHIYYNIKKTEYIGFCAIKQANQGN
ncbi:unnamed protein product [Larinioides sclopetarius]|uniref:Uncharacterized protein n=1 Tax=Larinioides sclopetarius TaxID=280406 RepID=A0AAV2A6K0_9ARAC